MLLPRILFSLIEPIVFSLDDEDGLGDLETSDDNSEDSENLEEESSEEDTSEDGDEPSKEETPEKEEPSKEDEDDEAKFLASQRGQLYNSALKNWEELREGIVKDASIKSLLTGVHGHDKTVFSNLASSIVSDIKELDNDVYSTVVANVGQDLARALWNAGKSNNDQELQKTAQVLNKFVSGHVSDPELSKEKQKNQALETEQARQLETIKREAHSSVMQTVTQQLNSKIDNILSKEGLNTFMSERIRQEIFAKLNAHLDSDMQQLSDQRAFLEQSHFPIKIQQAFANKTFNRAVAALPEVAKGLLSEAKKGMKFEVNKEEESEKKLNLKKTSGGRAVDYSKTSDMDILNDSEVFVS